MENENPKLKRVRYVIKLEDAGGMVLATFTSTEEVPREGEVLMIPVLNHGKRRGWAFNVNRVIFVEDESIYVCYEKSVRQCDIAEALKDLRGAEGWEIDDYLWVPSMSLHNDQIAEEDGEKGDGFLTIGHNDKGEVVMNLPRDMTGHILFSPEQAFGLAGLLWRRAEQLMIERGDKIAGRNPCPCGSGRMHKNCCAGNAKRAAENVGANTDKAIESMSADEQRIYYEGLARCIEMMLPPGPSSTGRMMFLTLMFDQGNSVSYVSNVERDGAMLAMMQLLTQWRQEKKNDQSFANVTSADQQSGILSDRDDSAKS